MTADLPAAPPAPRLLRPLPRLGPSAVVIGASTGGPQALDVVLLGMAPVLKHLPIFVVLHMPAEFTAVIANHVGRLTGLPAQAAQHSEEVKRGHIYFAPGNRHLGLARRGESVVMLHSDKPAENFCRPAVDFLFWSAAQVYGARALAIVLTGMGQDGLAGSRAIVERGGTVIVQDEASSVVWGMPGAVAAAGLASAVLPVGTIAGSVCDLVTRVYPKQEPRP